MQTNEKTFKAVGYTNTNLALCRTTFFQVHQILACTVQRIIFLTSTLEKPCTVHDIDNKVFMSNRSLLCVFLESAMIDCNYNKAIVKEDLLRDNMNSAIRLILQAHVNYHPVEAMQKKAQDLMTVFEKHGSDLNRQSYHQQTTNLDDIFTDINKKNLLDSVNELGFGLYYTTLVESNQRFDTLYLERNEEYARAPKEKMADLRATSEEANKKLFNMINAAVVFYGPEQYQSLIDELNSLVDNYQSSIGRRHATQQETDEDLNQDFDEIQQV